MRCPYCGDQHPDLARFCPKTGKTLERSGICKNCGASLPPEISFCPICGTEVDNTNARSMRFDFERILKQYPVQFALILSVIVAAGLFVVISNQRPSSRKDNPLTATYEKPLDTVTSAASPTRNATRTLTMTPTSGPWVACEGSYKSRLHVGDIAYVSPQPPLANRVRSDPSLDGKIIGHIQPGESMKILKGPACANQWVWWYVQADKGGLKGWTSEGDAESYWLNPPP